MGPLPELPQAHGQAAYDTTLAETPRLPAMRGEAIYDVALGALHVLPGLTGNVIHKIEAHALGGILTQPHLGMVAEAGPEAVIPLAVGKRNRAMDVFQQAANILGIPSPDGMMQKQGPEGTATTFDFPVTARMETVAVKAIPLRPEYAPFAYPSDEVNTATKFASLIETATIEKSNVIMQELHKTVTQAEFFSIDMVDNVKSIIEKVKIASSTMFTGSRELMPLVQNAAAQFGLPPALLAAVIQAESGWRPNAVSPAGAIGLTQVMPGTARAMGYNVAELARNPALQIEAGARYLSQQYRRFGSWSRNTKLCAQDFVFTCQSHWWYCRSSGTCRRSGARSGHTALHHLQGQSIRPVARNGRDIGR